MNKQLLVAGGVAALLLAVIGSFLAMIYGPDPEVQARTPGIETEARSQAGGAAFHPPDPEQAPVPMRGPVMRGYQLLMYTNQVVGGNGDQEKRLACRNCHFEAGRARDGISLVGAAGNYPRPAPDGRGGTQVMTLVRQVQACYRNNLGRTPPAEESADMQAIVFYLQWISRGVPMYEKVDWLGLSPMQLPQAPSKEEGRKIYAGTCAQCHGPGGQGNIGPALWGPASFTSGSQFMDGRLLGSFVHKYMPFRKPDLAPEAAAAAAAFVLTQPRSHPGEESSSQRPGAQATIKGPADPGLQPAAAASEKAPPDHDQALQELRRIAQRMQEKGPASMEKEVDSGTGLKTAFPESSGTKKPATLEEKLQMLENRPPALKPPKWTAGAVIHPEETKPGHGAGNVLISIPSSGRRLPQPPGHPAQTPRRSEDAAPADARERD
jgi:thiosulfate dehydrogenase